MDEIDEPTVEIGQPSKLLHGARCCAVTPPVLHWDERIEAIACSHCGRIYAPVVLDTLQVDRDAVIRAFVMSEGIRERTAAQLGVDRHAVRRRLEKHNISYDNRALVITYASRGPTADDIPT